MTAIEEEKEEKEEKKEGESRPLLMLLHHNQWVETTLSSLPAHA